jgi:hypothetical protein
MSALFSPGAVVVTVARQGFQASFATYRVQWTAIGTEPVDARSLAFRQLAREGLAGVEYVRGAFARDLAVRRASARLTHVRRST